MEDSHSHSQSHSMMNSSHEEDQTSPSELRLCSSNVETHMIYSSDHGRDPNSDAGLNSGNGSSSARYKLMSPAKLPISRSPCLTIPPGLSPTSFLESPVLLSNMKAEPSPTTGSFLKTHLMNGFGVHSAFPFSANWSNSERNTDGFEFKPHTSVAGLPSARHVISSGLNQQRSERFEQVQVQDQVHSQSFGSLPSVKSEMAVTSRELTLSAPVEMSDLPSGVDSDELSRSLVKASQSDNKDVGPSVTAERSSEDGYNWRKYGQKLVKGCEFPRSYYKCTHPNCEVKKIFERSHEGHITEIVYKGTHDHPKPQPSRRFMSGALTSIQEKTDKSSINAHISPNLEPTDTPELSPRGANDDGVEGAVSHLNNTNDEVDEDDPFSKRRKIDGGGVDVTAVVKPLREPRVVVQTVSEVDILDDGYRWRKYGQKVVRGNPNPRSYYKCTNAGCPVRKHVERASHDPKAVITTYEGKHNHDVPTGKNSSHDMVGSSTAVNGLPRTRSEAGDPISLDLGVGISSGTENRSGSQMQIQTPDSDPHQQSEMHYSNSGFRVPQVSPVSTYYGVINGGGNPYGSRENRVEGHNFETPPFNHSSNTHPQSLGRILLGP